MCKCAPEGVVSILLAGRHLKVDTFTHHFAKPGTGHPSRLFSLLYEVVVGCKSAVMGGRETCQGRLGLSAKLH
jgi:hypothetical protein